MNSNSDKLWKEVLQKKQAYLKGRKINKSKEAEINQTYDENTKKKPLWIRDILKQTNGLQTITLKLVLRFWVERWIREDVWKNDSTRLWNEPKNIWQELDVKETERDKKWVREPDELFY